MLRNWWHVLILLVIVVVLGGVYNARYGPMVEGVGGLFSNASKALTNRTKCFECENQLIETSGMKWTDTWKSSGTNASIFRDAFMRNRKPILGV